MAANKMLIDASHPEETRVVVLRGNRIEEFDFESQNRRQLKGNIYLAKVTRVEPSLQAAFVDYGGNRHGFLAFNEIHPDYYQIPVADRQALLDEEAADARRDRDDEHNNDARNETSNDAGVNDTAANSDETSATAPRQSAETDLEEEKPAPKPRRRRSRRKKAVAAETETASSDENVDPEGPAKEETDASSDEQSETAVISEEQASDPVQEPEQELAQNSNSEETNSESTEKDKDDPKNTPTSIAAIMETESISEPVADEDTQDDESAESDESEPAANAKPVKKRTRRTSRPSKKKLAEAAEEKAIEESAPVEEASTEKPADETDITDTLQPSDDLAESKTDDKSDEKTVAEENSEPVKPKPRRKRRSAKSSKSAEKKSEETALNDADAQTDSQESAESSEVESSGQEDALEEVPRPRRPRKHYKIQEVIKRRQVLLVQVVKEERGNKGAALTTYLSLAGRYSVLMPNTARGGGISRKITNTSDRKRLKTIASELKVPEGMGVILRTAGASRSKAEIQRDFEYLMRLWENVRALTLSSSAPCLVYEEGSLIKRSIRDLYGKNTGEVLVAGEEGFQEARSFMEMLMPDHTNNVKLYQEEQALFARFGVESQLDKMLSQQVTLKSGGYLVIDQTEALVAIDVNSGRATREHSIEDTALQTNLETAEEVARQLRLRDLAGLIVIDFIDMEENRNNRAVEKKLKDCLKHDRARIQVGRISHFGLLEMSRQRMRASVLESTMDVCPHCQGKGHLRSHSSVGLHILRSIEEHLLKNSRFDLVVKAAPEIALYVLNQKRLSVMEIEERFGLKIFIEGNRDLLGENFTIEKGDASTGERKPLTFIQAGQLSAESETSEPAETVAATDTADEKPAKRKRRRRRGRGGDDNREEATNTANSDNQNSDTVNGDLQTESSNEDTKTDQETSSNRNDNNKRRRTRGKRGGRNAREREENESTETNQQATAITAQPVDAELTPVEKEPVKRSRNSRPRKPKSENAAPPEPVAKIPAPTTAPEDNAGTEAAKSQKKEPPRPKRRTTRRSSSEKKNGEAPPPSDNTREVEPTPIETSVETPSPTATTSGSETDKDGGKDQDKKRGGWWSRTGFFN